MDYIAIAEAAEKWGITPRRVQVLCYQGRIPGVAKLGRAWTIPKDAEKRRTREKESLFNSMGPADVKANAALRLIHILARPAMSSTRAAAP